MKDEKELLREEILRVFGENKIEIESGYKYSIMTSCTSVSAYGEEISNAESIGRHILHIATDYESEGNEVLIAKGFIKEDTLIANILLRRKAD
jgi:hypothetical protein